MKKPTIMFLGAVALVGMSVAPALVSAQSVSAAATNSASAPASGSSTVAALEAQIASLLSQLTTLRAQLNVAIGSSTLPVMPSSTLPIISPAVPMAPASSTVSGMPMCPAFSRNLSIGAQGSDVMQLQSVLVQNGNLPQGDTTGYFGPLTAKALANFQVANDIASSSSATGFFGPLTRAFLGQRCLTLPGSNGGAVPPPAGTPPIYNGPTTGMLSPTSGPVGTTVTITGVAASGGGGLGTTETVLMGGLVAARDVSVAADGSLTFTVPSSLAPNCAADQACPMFLAVTTPRAYPVSLIAPGATTAAASASISATAAAAAPIPVGIFTVTGNGSSSFVSPAVPITPIMPPASQ